jgi:hypothetical protein
MWQMCRVVLTAESIQLMNLGQVHVLDMIPFDEVMDVNDVMDNEVYLPLTMKGHEPSRFLQITTAENGFNCGRIYRFKPLSDSLKVEIIKSALENNLIKRESWGKRARFASWQNEVRAIFESNLVQSILSIFVMAVSGVFCGLITVSPHLSFSFPAYLLHLQPDESAPRQNFALNIVESQLIDEINRPDGSPTDLGRSLKTLNVLFLVLFIAELLTNLAVNWWRRFFRSPWSLLDAAMVIAGILTTSSLNAKVLRLLRIARVLRIFGKVRSTNYVLLSLLLLLSSVITC